MVGEAGQGLRIGRTEAIVEATDLRTHENVLRLIDPAILVRAFTNNAAAAPTAEPSRDRLRRLVPNPALSPPPSSRKDPTRACSQLPGRAHTTLARYFRQPEVARQLRHRPPARPGEPQTTDGARTHISQLTTNPPAPIAFPANCGKRGRRGPGN